MDRSSKWSRRSSASTGMAQGVYYRASAQARAQALGLRGWVRNLPDGRVANCALQGTPREGGGGAGRLVPQRPTSNT